MFQENGAPQPTNLNENPPAELTAESLMEAMSENAFAPKEGEKERDLNREFKGATRQPLTHFRTSPHEKTPEVVEVEKKDNPSENIIVQKGHLPPLGQKTPERRAATKAFENKIVKLTDWKKTLQHTPLKDVPEMLAENKITFSNRLVTTEQTIETPAEDGANRKSGKKQKKLRQPKLTVIVQEAASEVLPEPDTKITNTPSVAKVPMNTPRANSSKTIGKIDFVPRASRQPEAIPFTIRANRGGAPEQKMEEDSKLKKPEPVNKIDSLIAKAGGRAAETQDVPPETISFKTRAQRAKEGGEVKGGVVWNDESIQKNKMGLLEKQKEGLRIEIRGLLTAKLTEAKENLVQARMAFIQQTKPTVQQEEPDGMLKKTLAFFGLKRRVPGKREESPVVEQEELAYEEAFIKFRSILEDEDLQRQLNQVKDRSVLAGKGFDELVRGEKMQAWEVISREIGLERLALASHRKEEMLPDKDREMISKMVEMYGLQARRGRKGKFLVVEKPVRSNELSH